MLILRLICQLNQTVFVKQNQEQGMAYCASSFGLRNRPYMLDDCFIEANSMKRCSENTMGGLRSPRFRCRTSNAEAVLLGCMRSRRKQKIQIWGMLIPRETGPKLADSSTGMRLQEETNSSVVEDSMDSEANSLPEPSHGGDGGDSFGGSGGNGKFPPGGGGGGGDQEESGEEEEFGPLLKYEEVIREAEARGASLPSDMLEAAKAIGIRRVLLLRYLDLQVV